MISHITKCLALVFVLGLSSNSVLAATYVEVPDAGELPGTAQTTMGVGALDAIVGMTTDPSDYADMYQIFISNPAAFSASTGNGSATFDTQLFLFDLAGLGVLANDDFGSLVRSKLPVGSFVGVAGLYYLAISGYDYDPFSVDGEIFPDCFPCVHGPAGLGGGAAVTHWATSNSLSNGTYQIDLTGVQFANGSSSPTPEPSTMLLLGSGLIGLIGYRMKKKL